MYANNTTGNVTASTTIPNSGLANSAITINGTSTSLGGSINVGTVTGVTATSPVTSTGGTAPVIAMPAATTSVSGYLTSTDWNTFNNKGSGSVTSVGGTGSVNGITLTGTVTSSGNLTLGGTLSGIGNSQLTNSTISGVALGSNLANLVAGTNITFSSGTTYNGSTAITISSAGSSSSYSRTNITATSGQTTFTVTYTVGYVLVYVNGVLLDTTDYTATNGTTVVLSVGANLNDLVTFVALTTSPIVSIGGSNTQVQYNNGGALAGSANMTFNGTTLSSSFNGSIGATTRSSGDFTTLSGNTVTSTTPVLSFNAANSIATFGSTTSGSYNQLVIQNKSNTAGTSTNYVLSNDLGTDSSYYGEFGMNSSSFSASTSSDFFSINNGVYFSAHDGDVTVGSGNGYKTYLAWGTTGQSAHVINASGAIGLSTNLGTTPTLSGTTGFGTSGQALVSQGNASPPIWSTVATVGGSTTQIQYNNAGVLAGNANFTYTGTDVNIPFGPSNSATSIAKVALALSMIA
jgi:hypothetical protein